MQQIFQSSFSPHKWALKLRKGTTLALCHQFLHPTHAPTCSSGLFCHTAVFLPRPKFQHSSLSSYCMDNLVIPLGVQLLMLNASLSHSNVLYTWLGFETTNWLALMRKYSSSHSGSKILFWEALLCRYLPHAVCSDMPCQATSQWIARFAKILIPGANLPFKEDSPFIQLRISWPCGCPHCTLQDLTPSITHGCVEAFFIQNELWLSDQLSVVLPQGSAPPNGF